MPKGLLAAVSSNLPNSSSQISDLYLNVYQQKTNMRLLLPTSIYETTIKVDPFLSFEFIYLFGLHPPTNIYEGNDKGRFPHFSSNLSSPKPTTKKCVSFLLQVFTRVIMKVDPLLSFEFELFCLNPSTYIYEGNHKGRFPPSSSNLSSQKLYTICTKTYQLLKKILSFLPSADFCGGQWWRQSPVSFFIVPKYTDNERSWTLSLLQIFMVAPALSFRIRQIKVH